jgi:hypothetical protein
VVPERVAEETAEETVNAEEVAVVQHGITSPEAGVQQDAIATKPPKIGRKGNLLRTKPGGPAQRSRLRKFQPPRRLMTRKQPRPLPDE